MQNLTPSELVEVLKSNRCPDCHYSLLAGPRLESHMIVLCSNLSCRQEFELDVIHLSWGCRNGKCSEERAKAFGPVVCFIPTNPRMQNKKSIWRRLHDRMLKGGLEPPTPKEKSHV